MTEFLTSALLGVLLVVTAASKLTRRRQFIRVLMGYRFIPKHLAPLLSRLLPLVEGITGIWLISRVYMPLPAVAAAALFAFFGAVMLMATVFGLRGRSCGCGFPKWLEGRIGWSVVGRDGVLACIALLSGGITETFVWAAMAAFFLVAIAGKLLTTQRRLEPGTRTAN